MIQARIWRTQSSLSFLQVPTKWRLVLVMLWTKQESLKPVPDPTIKVVPPLLQLQTKAKAKVPKVNSLPTRPPRSHLQSTWHQTPQQIQMLTKTWKMKTIECLMFDWIYHLTTYTLTSNYSSWFILNILIVCKQLRTSIICVGKSSSPTLNCNSRKWWHLLDTIK